MELSPGLIWFLVGVVFLLAEFLLPGFILMFFTAGCWIVALILWGFDIGVTTQITIFIITSLILLLTLRKYSMKVFKGSTRDDVDDDYTNSKIGMTAEVTKQITPELPGEIKVAGSFWRASADETIEPGTAVKIVNQESKDGLTFEVESTGGEK